MPANARLARRPLWATSVLSLYLVAAFGMAVLVAAPHFATPPADEADLQLGWRAAFALAALLNGAIGLGGLRSLAWVRPLAGSVHVLVALAAVAFGVMHARSPAPPEGWLPEHLAKFGVHAGLAWWWLRGALGRVVQTPTGAASPTGARSGSADHTTR